MRLFKRGLTYYVEFGRGDKQSLKTTDEKEAKAVFAKLRRELLMNRLVRLEAQSNISLDAFRKEYVESRTGVSHRTKAQDELSLTRLAEVLGGATPLKLIDSKRIDGFKRVCIAGGLKPVSVNSYLRHIKAALSAAVEWGYLKTRPRIKMMPLGKQLPRYLRPEQITAILKKADELHPGEFSDMLRFYLWTGARRNEALGLQWQDIHLDGDRPYVLLTGKGNRQRAVPLVAQVVKILKPRQRDMGYVFSRIHESTVTHWFHAIALAAGLDAKLHDLRHTSATYMLSSGIPIRMVQEILGHAQLSTTAIYTEVIKEHLHKEMSKLKFE